MCGHHFVPDLGQPLLFGDVTNFQSLVFVDTNCREFSKRGTQALFLYLVIVVRHPLKDLVKLCCHILCTFDFSLLIFFWSKPKAED